MRKSLRFTSVRITIIALACLFLSVTGTRADTFTYTYTGNNFTSVISPYTTSERLTGTFELSAALPANLDFANESSLVTSFTMSDGVQTLTSPGAFVEFFRFSTDSAGTITLWDVEVANSSGTAPSMETLNFGFASSDQGSLTNFVSGINNGAAGIWTVSSTTPVPEPGTLGMVFSSLLGLGVLVGLKRNRENRLADRA